MIPTETLSDLNALVAGRFRATPQSASFPGRHTLSPHRISLRRTQFDMSIDTIGTDAYNAINAIPGVSAVRIESEDESVVQLSYNYKADAAFSQTAEYLAPFWLERA